MAGFRGTRTSAQPRTLRTVAEDKGTAPSGRDVMPFNAQAGIPDGEIGQAGSYDDIAKAALPPAGSGVRTPGAEQPKPFGKGRG